MDKSEMAKAGTVKNYKWMSGDRGYSKLSHPLSKRCHCQDECYCGHGLYCNSETTNDPLTESHGKKG